MNKLKENKAITLIALVITIIVLLILAGVAINSIMGQDSAPEKAAQARMENDKGAARDAATLLVSEKINGYYDAKFVKRTTEAETVLAYLQEELSSAKAITTGDGYKVVVADGKIAVTKTGESTEFVSGTVNNDGVIVWDGSGTGGTSNQIAENSVEALAKSGEIKKWDKINYNPGTATTANIELPEGASIEGTKLASIASELPAGATIDGTINASDATDWVVIDVNETTGEVKIIPTYITGTKLTLTGLNGYNNSIDAMNKVASIYLNSEYASDSKPIKVEDLYGDTLTMHYKSDDYGKVWTIKSKYHFDITSRSLTELDELSDEKYCSGLLEYADRNWGNFNGALDILVANMDSATSINTRNGGRSLSSYTSYFRYW